MRCFSFILFLAVTLFASKPVKLPKAAMSGGTPLYETLTNRSTGRQFSKKKLSRKQISQILWSAAGVNRPESGKRTSPSAWGNNEVEVYVLLPEGTFKYDVLKHSLNEISKEDNRGFGGLQEFVTDAPLTLILVADLSKITQTKDETTKLNLSYIDAGYISQNIYLAAASEGLITGARAMVDHKKLKEVLKLSDTQRVIVANSVGYAK